MNLGEVDKRNVDMSDGILIDDNAEMLDTCNAKTKVAFGGDVYPWSVSKINMYQRCYNWTEVEKLLLS